MLKLDEVCVQLGIRKWQLNIDLQQNGVYALLGRSGSGKSTLLNLVAGFLKPDSGHIYWKEQFINELQPAKRPVTTLFQDHNLFSHLSVYQNIGLGVNPGLKLSEGMQRSIDEVLEEVGLAGYQKKLPGQLSGGEQQRVALARCLLRRQPILLLDEPFSALDATTRHEMTELLRAVIDKFKPCVIMVTHDEDDAIALNATVLRMHDDSVVFE